MVLTQIENNKFGLPYRRNTLWGTITQSEMFKTEAIHLNKPRIVGSIWYPRRLGSALRLCDYLTNGAQHVHTNSHHVPPLLLFHESDIINSGGLLLDNYGVANAGYGWRSPIVLSVPTNGRCGWFKVIGSAMSDIDDQRCFDATCTGPRGQRALLTDDGRTPKALNHESSA